MAQQYSYHYGAEAEQYSFYRIPRSLFLDERFAGLSTNAKVLYGLLLDRMSLSQKHGWFDEENRVYINFKLEEITKIFHCSPGTGCKMLSELDVDNADGYGLIRRVKPGQGKATTIYVLKITEHSGHTAMPDEPLQKEKPQISNHQQPTIAGNEGADFSKPEANYNNISYTNPTYTDQSNPIPDDDEIGYEQMQATVKENLDYDILRDHFQPGQLDMAVNLVTEILCSRKNKITVAKDEYPAELVKDRLSQLTGMHVEYVFDCLRKNTTPIRNIKQYLLAALFNAPVTMESYYAAQVNHDLYGSRS